MQFYLTATCTYNPWLQTICGLSREDDFPAVQKQLTDLWGTAGRSLGAANPSRAHWLEHGLACSSSARARQRRENHTTSRSWGSALLHSSIPQPGTASEVTGARGILLPVWETWLGEHRGQRKGVQ